ncbi:hypothetical protein HYALB_00007245 [Hymenoscyphus albidus]|uniref:Uncharacterized protein n=1 Tax=Hymenoscyphus albidus TaxID=595503 RepID=A0A9N9LDK2_9HELO|nr:hypothetical protein HYALB_00007245 [Hymenoscyphus albidus]
MRALPQSLEYLTLVGTTEEEVPSIAALIRNKTTYIPHLKELNLYWSILKYPENKTRSLSETLYKHPGFTREEACELWQDCIAKGVKMLVTSCTPPNEFAE